MAIEDQELYDFVHSSIDNSFGLDIQTIAENSKNRGRFSAWLNGNVSQIVSLLETVRDNGVSPAFFASYEITEGYNSSWGWLNHTTPQGNPTQDAISVTNWIKDTSQDMSQSPAWIDYANYNDFVPQSAKDFGNDDFANMASGTIGRVVIAGTAAATWEVYYPNGLLAEYNGVQDYGAPLTKMKDLILQWGGTIGGDGGNGGGGSGGISKNNVISIINDHHNDINISHRLDTGNLVDRIVSELEKIYQRNLTQISENFYRNIYFKITQTYNNLLKINPNAKLSDVIEQVINDSLDELTVTVNDNIDQVFSNMVNAVNNLDGSSNNVISIINNHHNDINISHTLDTGNLVDRIVSELEKIYQRNLTQISENFYRNIYFKITQTYNNLLKINPNAKLSDVIEQVINDSLDELTVTVNDNIDQVFSNMVNAVNNLDGSSNGGGNGGSDEKYFPVDVNASGVNFWAPPHATNLQHNMDFGTRTDGDFHAGFDVGGGGVNHNIYATTSGTVTASDYVAGWGNRVVIEHSSDNYHSLYAHLSSQNVSQGDTVNAGDLIGVMGTTGASASIHLHYELSETGAFNDGNTIDPKNYLGVTGDNSTSLPNPTS